jgi:hypothetical protein
MEDYSRNVFRSFCSFQRAGIMGVMVRGAVSDPDGLHAADFLSE